ncbi:LysR family transcriptional regulator [Rhodovibrionaceae bacterium A322]
MSLSLKQIHYFLAVAEAGQVSQGAKNLNVSQSAVTAAIKNLEELLNTKLFDRHSNGVSLTFEGHQFHQHALHISSSVDEAMRIQSRSHEQVEGTIRVAATYTVAGYFLPTYLARFARAFPNVEIKLEEMDRAYIEEGLIADTYDISVLLTSNIVNQEDIGFETLLRSRRRLWVCTDHHFLSRPAVSLQEISEEPYITLTVDEASNTAQKYWNRTPYRPQTYFRTNSVEAVRSMVGNGMGIALLSDMVYRPWSLEGHRIEVREVSDPIPTMDVGLAWKEGKELVPAAQAFRAFLRLAFSGSDQSLLNFNRG